MMQPHRLCVLSWLLGFDSSDQSLTEACAQASADGEQNDLKLVSLPLTTAI